MDLKEFQKLKDEVAQLQEQTAKAQGAYEQTKRRIKEEFDFTLKSAETHLATWERELAQLEKELARETAKFRKQFGKRLKGEDNGR